ncbi:hypothetical protein ACH4OW_35265 [Streptomyces sp. NPDC017056]|uniref:hypothetical protein n=1 Tax=Streptomyces sp. NPDC017056 TaxID=3364973 RepID=UPI00379CD566
MSKPFASGKLRRFFDGLLAFSASMLKPGGFDDHPQYRRQVRLSYTALRQRVGSGSRAGTHPGSSSRR